MRSLVIVVVACGLLSAPAARAGWTLNVAEPDVFGNKVVQAVATGLRDGLIVKCDQTTLEFGYLFKKKEADDIKELPAELLVQVDGGKPSHLQAETRGWNDLYGGIIADSRNIETVAVLRMIGAAKKAINVGAIVGTAKITASFDAASSTTAMDGIIKNCGLADIKPDQPAATPKP